MVDTDSDQEPVRSKQSGAMKVLKRRQWLYQAVQEEVKSYIVKNGLKPGEPLPSETELAQQLGVSRSSVREAVKSLETLGILEARTGAGLFVSSFSFDPLINNLGYGTVFDLEGLTDILEVRSYIEYGMVERAINAVTAQQLQRLRVLLERMRLLAEQGIYSPENDRNFHQVLWENVGNTVAARILDVFWKVFHEAQERAAIPEPVDPVGTYQAHVRIVEALEQGALEAMRANVRSHYIGIARCLDMLRNAEGKHTG